MPPALEVKTEILAKELELFQGLGGSVGGPIMVRTVQVEETHYAHSLESSRRRTGDGSR
jgi:hypothetical protein